MDNVQIAEYIIYFNIIVNICLLVFFYIKKANSKYKLIGWINFILYIILFIGIILYTLPMQCQTFYYKGMSYSEYFVIDIQNNSASAYAMISLLTTHIVAFTINIVNVFRTLKIKNKNI